MASGYTARRIAENGRNAWLWIERALLVSGLGLAVIFGATRMESSFGSRAALKSLAVLASSAPSSLQSRGEGSRSGVVELAALEQPGAPLAVLEIPKIHLAVPLLDGTDALTLNHAVGRIAGTAWPGEAGNIGIAGHRDGFFRGLKNIAVGDVIQLKAMNATDTYIVSQIRIVAPSDVAVLGPRPVPSVTLVTCYPFHFIGSAPKRFIVTASLQQDTETESDRF